MSEMDRQSQLKIQKPDLQGDLVQSYFELCSKLAIPIEKVSLETACKLKTADPDRFFSLSTTQKKELLERLANLYEVVSSVHFLRSSLNHAYLRTCLKKFGWKLDTEIFNKLQETDTIEVYGTDFTLKVANMRFIELCSYSLEDILSHEFHQLFNRDPKLTEHLVSCATQICVKKSGTIYDLGPDHLVWEAFSTKRRKFWVHSNFVTPIYTKWNSVAGFLYSATARVIEN